MLTPIWIECKYAIYIWAYSVHGIQSASISAKLCEIICSQFAK